MLMVLDLNHWGIWILLKWNMLIWNLSPPGIMVGWPPRWCLYWLTFFLLVWSWNTWNFLTAGWEYSPDNLIVLVTAVVNNAYGLVPESGAIGVDRAHTANQVTVWWSARKRVRNFARVFVFVVIAGETLVGTMRMLQDVLFSLVINGIVSVDVMIGVRRNASAAIVSFTVVWRNVTIASIMSASTAMRTLITMRCVRGNAKYVIINIIHRKLNIVDTAISISVVIAMLATVRSVWPSLTKGTMWWEIKK